MARVVAFTDLPEHARLLLAIRKQRGWSQGNLAAQLSVSVRTLRNWEHGTCDPAPQAVEVFRALLTEGIEGTGWAHLAALDNIARDARAGILTRAQADALKDSLYATLRALNAAARTISTLVA